MLDLVLYNYFSANVDCGAPEDRRGRNEESQSVSDSTDSYQMIEYGLKYAPAILLQSNSLTGNFSHQFLSEGNMNQIKIFFPKTFQQN